MKKILRIQHLKHSKETVKKQQANSTVSICRSGLFLPIKKSAMNDNKRIFSNKWVNVTVTGNINQTHQNIIDAIFASAINIEKSPDGQIGIQFSPYRVLKKIGHNKPTNYKWLFDRLEELRIAQVLIVSADTSKGESSGIIRLHRWSKVPNLKARKGSGFNKESFLYGVVFERGFAKFFNIETNINYLRKLDDIVSLSHGINQSLVRFCLSHNRLNMDLKEVLSSLGLDGDISKSNIKKIYRNINEEREYMKEKFSIEIKKASTGNNTVFYKKLDDVYFLNPK